MEEKGVKNFRYFSNAIQGSLTRSQTSIFTQALTSGSSQEPHLPLHLHSNILVVFERKIEQHIRRNKILSLKEINSILNMIGKMKCSKNQAVQVNTIKMKILKIYNTLLKREFVKKKKKRKSKTKRHHDTEVESMGTDSVDIGNQCLTINQANLFDTSELLPFDQENGQKVNFGATSEICTVLDTKTNESETIDTLNVGNMEITFMGNNDQLSPSDLPFELLTNTNFETVENSACVSNNYQCELFTDPSKDIKNRSSTSLLDKLQQTVEVEPGSKGSLLPPSALIECSCTETDNADILGTLDDTISKVDLSMNCSDTYVTHNQPKNAQATLTLYPINHNIIEIDNSPTNCFIQNKGNIESYSSIIEKSEIDQVNNRVVPAPTSHKDNIKVPSILAIDKNPEIIIEGTQCSSEDFTLDTQPMSSSNLTQPQSPSLLNYKTNPQSLDISPTSVKNEKFMGFSQSDKKNIRNSHPKLNRGKAKKLCNKTILTEVPNKNTKNIMLVNEGIHQSGDKLFSQTSECTHDECDEIESLINKQRDLKKKIKETRKKYEATWGTKSIEQRVSAKFAKKFHIRIFDEPVEALTNIQYTPNFKNHKFPLLTLKTVHKQLKASQLSVQAIGVAIGKVVDNLTEENTEDIHQTSKSDSDSGTSDDDIKENEQWLKEYYFKKTKNSLYVRDEDAYNDCKNKHPGAESLDDARPCGDQRDINEELENILRNMSID